MLPKIIAHRGFSSRYPENTLIAFEKAIEIGVDGIELDLRRTADNRIVAIHDEEISRTTVGEGAVYKMRLDQLKCYPIKDHLGVIWEDQRIPTIEEIFELIKNSSVELWIEIKETGIENSLMEAIKRYNLKERVMIISFYPTVLRKIKHLEKDIKTSILCAPRLVNTDYEEILPYIDGIDIGYIPLLLDEELIKRAKDDGLILGFWTINNEEQFEEVCSRYKPEYITTDCPDLLITG